MFHVYHCFEHVHQKSRFFMDRQTQQEVHTRGNVTREIGTPEERHLLFAMLGLRIAQVIAG